MVTKTTSPAVDPAVSLPKGAPDSEGDSADAAKEAKQQQKQQQQQQQQQHQQEQRQHQHDNSGSNRQGTNIGSPVSFNKDDEALRLLQQLAAEQSELLDRLHVVNPSALAASAVIVRPTEQYLTIALNGKNTDLIGLQHLVSCIFAMSVLSHNIEYSAQ